MGLFDFLKKKTKEMLRPYTAAIIAAAGSGSRMKDSCENKQLLFIGGKPVIGHTLSAFESSTTIDEIIIVTREEDILPIADIVKTFGFSKVTKIIKGGETRQESVFNAISELNKKTKFISIHDGARPFVTPEMIDAVSTHAYSHNAAAACVKIKDTIKQVDSEGNICDTIDRATLLAVQTPQTFSLNLYLSGMATANKRGVHLTDDCQIIEQIGGKVFAVEGSYNNIKITTPEDILFAEHIINSVDGGV